jgi:hypothetical protein
MIRTNDHRIKSIEMPLLSYLLPVRSCFLAQLRRGSSPNSEVRVYENGDPKAAGVLSYRRVRLQVL